MKKVIFVLSIFSSLFVFGCNYGKPAYSDIKVDNKTAAQNSDPAASASQDPIARAEREAGVADAALQNPAQVNKEIQMPSFLVPGKSEIKDLPKYKKAPIINAQIGPVNGVSSAMFIYESRDSVDEISKFYEGAFKTNGWQPVSTVKDPDNFEYTLMKGVRDEASVRIKKDPQSGSTFIMLSRIEKPVDQNVSVAPVPEKKK